MINTLRKPITFFVDDWFDKIIIKKNKDKVRLLANILLNEFLKETVALNIMISLVKIREVMTKKMVPTMTIIA